MAAAKKPATRTAPPKRPRTVPDDLEAVVREALRDVVALKPTSVKKALPRPYQAFEKEAKDIVQKLVGDGALVKRKVGKTELFFAHDPTKHLDAVIGERLEETLDSAKLKAWIKEEAPGYEAVFKEWLEHAVQTKILFEYPSAPRSRDKRYARRPDAEAALTVLLEAVARPLEALRKALVKNDSDAVPRFRLGRAVLIALGLPMETTGPAVEAGPAPGHTNGLGHDRRPEFLRALDALADEHDEGVPLLVRDLRRRLPFDKAEFDALALGLFRAAIVSLYHHDLPHADPHRDDFVPDGSETSYHLIARRRSP